VDRLWGTHLVEWELVRRQRRVEQLAAGMDTFNQNLETLAEELTLNRLMLCLVNLRARSERDDLDDWLRFAPHRDGEDALLDSAIDCLVKPRLARVDADSVGPREYIYYLNPDWAAIADRLRNMAAEELVSWVEEQV
jgi:hypothetical protein